MAQATTKEATSEAAAKTTQVLIVARSAGNVVEFLIVANIRGRKRISRKQTTTGPINGNPYLVYGDAVAKFCNVDKFATSIDVATITSGDLDDWR